MIRKPRRLFAASPDQVRDPLSLTISVPGAVERNRSPEDHRQFDEIRMVESNDGEYPIRTIIRYGNVSGLFQVSREAGLDILANGIHRTRYSTMTVSHPPDVGFSGLDVFGNYRVRLSAVYCNQFRLVQVIPTPSFDGSPVSFKKHSH